MEEQEYECDACEEVYNSMSYLAEVEVGSGDLEGVSWACRHRRECREAVITQAEEDRVAKEIRGRLLKDREDREALLPGGALAVRYTIDTPVESNKFEKLREDVEKLNAASPLDTPRDAEKIVAQLRDILAAMPDRHPQYHRRMREGHGKI